MVKIKDYLDNLIYNTMCYNGKINFYQIRRNLNKIGIKLSKQALLNRIKRL